MLELHDGKFIYALTQHSLFTREFYPFLLCRCGRGDGLASSVCYITSDEDYTLLQQKARKKLKKFLRDEYSGKSLTDLTDAEFTKAMNDFRKKM